LEDDEESKKLMNENIGFNHGWQKEVFDAFTYNISGGEK